MVWLTWGISLSLAFWEGIYAQTDSDFNTCSSTARNNLGLLILLPYTAVKALIVFLIPFGVQAWIGWRIYRAARANSIRTRKSSSNLRNLSRELSQDSTGSVVDYNARPSFSGSRAQVQLNRQWSVASVTQKLKKRSSTFSLYKEEGRTARLSSLVSVISIVAWSPFFIHNLCLTLAPRWSLLSASHELSIAFLYTYGAISPFLYGFRSNRIWREVLCTLRLRSRQRKFSFFGAAIPEYHSKVSHDPSSPMPAAAILMEQCISYATKPLLIDPRDATTSDRPPSEQNVEGETTLGGETPRRSVTIVPEIHLNLQNGCTPKRRCLDLPQSFLGRGYVSSGSSAHSDGSGTSALTIVSAMEEDEGSRLLKSDVAVQV